MKFLRLRIAVGVTGVEQPARGGVGGRLREVELDNNKMRCKRESQGRTFPRSVRAAGGGRRDAVVRIWMVMWAGLEPGRAPLPIPGPPLSSLPILIYCGRCCGCFSGFGMG